MSSTGFAAPAAAATIRVQQVRGLAGSTRRQREVVRGLGLRRIGHTVTRPDTPVFRGMVARVPHLVRIVAAEPSAGSVSNGGRDAQ